MKKKVYK